VHDRAGPRAGTTSEPEILPIDVLSVETSKALGLIESARRYDLTVYDTAYLELADIRGLGLATLDKRLSAACRTSGVTVIAA
jgi:predicted nucleic acid-binding protein